MQAYSLTYEQALDMTLPQILMTSHSANVNYERGQKRFDAKKKREDARKETAKNDPDPFIESAGKRLSQMNTDEYLQHCIVRG